ncbi:MAG TPA: c-type cytochrome [Nitrospirota bacterium]|nr:c-type cytochrome [Nitrospirota bacterium]
MKKGVLKLAIIVIGLNLIFVYIGMEFLPQSESRPPKVIKVEAGISQDDLISVGEEIVFGKGQCMVCHVVKPEAGMRAPAMSSIGAEMEREAKERGIPVEDHVFEALVNPSKYIVKGFEDMMSPVQTPPTSLTDGEIIAVAAYLQSKGGKVTVSYPGSVPVLKAQIAKAGGK